MTAAAAAHPSAAAVLVLLLLLLSVNNVFAVAISCTAAVDTLPFTTAAFV